MEKKEIDEILSNLSEFIKNGPYGFGPGEKGCFTRKALDQLNSLATWIEIQERKDKVPQPNINRWANFFLDAFVSDLENGDLCLEMFDQKDIEKLRKALKGDDRFNMRRMKDENEF